MNCRDCKHWKREGERVRSPYDGHDDEDTETVYIHQNEDGVTYPFEIGICDQPKLLKFIRPEDISGATVIDGSTYMARLLTAEGFGCVNFGKRK